MNPFCIPFAINNMGGALLAMDLNFMGPNYSISTACATGNFCILRWGPHLLCAPSVNSFSEQATADPAGSGSPGGGSLSWPGCR